MSKPQEFSLVLLGLVLAGFGGALLWRAKDIHDARIAAGVLGTGLLLVVPKQLAENIKLVGSACAEAWRKKNDASDGGGPAGGGAP